MAIIVLVSASGSPGVTTSAIGLTTRWDRPCLLLEADPTGASAMLASLMGNYAADRIPGIFDLAVRYRQTGTLPKLLDVSVQPAGTTFHLLSGLRSPTQATTISDVWPPLIAELRELDKGGIDVIVDAGRLGLVGTPTALLQVADLVLLVTRTTLPVLAAVKSWTPPLLKTVGVGRGQVGLLIIGPGQPHTTGEIKKTVQLPVIAQLPFDPVAAEVFSRNQPQGRRFETSRLNVQLTPARDHIRHFIATSESLVLEGGTS